MRINLFVLAFCTVALAGPCDDPQYLEVKSKSIDSLSDAQMQYLIAKDKECSEYQASQAKDSLQAKEDAKAEKEWQQKKGGIAAGIVFGVLGLIAVSIVPLFINY